MRTAGVVIVGGGVVGASVAYHLAARGARDVLVLERGAGPGEGSTGRATGGFRAQFGTEAYIRPLEILRGYTEAAKRLGVRFRYGVAVEGFRGGGGRRVGSLLTTAG